MKNGSTFSRGGREDRLTGAEAVALFLRSEGVDVTFGYPGTSELALCLSIARTSGTAFINSRGDREAVFMAAGASLLRPTSAAAILHGARGSTNACGAIAVVRRNEVAVLLLVGLPSRRSAPFLPPHGEPSLLGDLGRFAKGGIDLAEIDEPRRFIETLHGSLNSAREPPPGPVLIGIPQDLLEQPWIPPEALHERRLVPEPPRPPMLEDALQLVRRSRRVVILLDDYLLKDRDALRPLAEFARLRSAPVFQVRYRRGPMLFERLSRDVVSSFVGWYDPNNCEHAATLAEADLLVTVEDRNMYARVVGPLPKCPKLVITSAPAKTMKNAYVRDQDIVLEGTVSRTLAKLVEELRTTPTPANLPVSVSAMTRRASSAACGAKGRLIRTSIAMAFASLFRSARTPVLVDDSQMFGGMLADEYDRFPPHLRVFGDHAGFVGAGIPLATGLALHEQDACVVCAVGDQGFTNGVQGLVAAGERQSAVIFIVCNNDESVSLHKQLLTLDESPDSVNLCGLRNAPNLDYAAVARACGIDASLVVLSEEMTGEAIRNGGSRLRRILRTARSSRKPYLIELKLPSLGETWDGIWITEGFEALKPQGSSVLAVRGASEEESRRSQVKRNDELGGEDRVRS